MRKIISLLLLIVMLWTTNIFAGNSSRTYFTKYWINCSGNLHKGVHTVLIYVELDTNLLKQKILPQQTKEYANDGTSLYFIEGNVGYFEEPKKNWFENDEIYVYLPKEK